MRRPTLVLSIVIVMLLVGAYFAWRAWGGAASRIVRLREYLGNPQAHRDWIIQAGSRCGTAPFIFPTDGYLGFVRGDSFRPLHRHQGIDIFGTQPLGQTPVISAYPGYLTRLADWKSSVIVRVPQDPLQPGRQIWLYYTHMADERGNSFIAEDFPAGSHEVPVAAGTLLGHQGDYSGDPNNPVGIHLHFSVVRDDGLGNFRNELEFGNTLPLSPYLGLPLEAGEARTWPIACP
jgi:peptidoglycan LD-endopeptidase LytH